MRVAISGASGFIGAAVARHLIQHGHEVAAVARPGSDLARLGAHARGIAVIRGQLADPDSILTELARFAPEVGIHAAWDGISGGSRDDLPRQGANFGAAIGFLDACRRAGASAWMGLGSQAEYGAANRRLDETAPADPSSFYGTVKLAVCHTTEVACRRAGLRHAWMRVFNTYGPGDSPNFLVPSLIEQLLDGKRAALSAGTQVWDLLHVEDAAAAIAHVATRADLDGVFNLGSGDPRTIRRIAEDVRDAVDPALELAFGEVPVAPGGPTHLEADIGRLERSGWRPSIAWADGLHDTVAWHRARRRAAACVS